jgi:hypothetical protein
MQVPSLVVFVALQDTKMWPIALAGVIELIVCALDYG